MKRRITSLLLTLLLSCGSIFAGKFNASAGCDNALIRPAQQTYQELNQADAFAVSIGLSMSQTHHSTNTAHPDFMQKKLQELTLLSPNPMFFLSLSDHIGYVLRALPVLICSNCGTNINPAILHVKNDEKIITQLLNDIIVNRAQEKLTVKTCPSCQGQLTEQTRKEIKLTPAHQQAIIDQLNYLGVKNQASCTKHNLPTYRISIEASDILVQNSTEIDAVKLQAQAEFLQKLGNPLIFCHHYSNPQSIPNLFEKEEHIEWFANYCAQVIKSSPHVTHACPISQPVAFSHRVTRGTLPPFTCTISQANYLKNINMAQIAACKKMKEANPNLKVLMSHQWKLFKPLHSRLNPWYALEYIVCSIADRMYNGNFVTIFQPYQDLFDGIALSVYPALKFNGWIPQGDNCSGYFNYEDTIETIMQTHRAFPTKDIYIVETGCNTIDPQLKKEFIDMTLQACKKARENGAPVKGVYFWSHTNDPEFYSEWGLQQGTTNFSPFDRLEITNPCSSINASGIYFKEILSKN